MNPQEQPAAGTPCVVADCSHPATVYVDVGESPGVEAERAVGMCDEHAVHWRDGER